MSLLNESGFENDRMYADSHTRWADKCEEADKDARRWKLEQSGLVASRDSKSWRHSTHTRTAHGFRPKGIALVSDLFAISSIYVQYCPFLLTHF